VLRKQEMLSGNSVLRVDEETGVGNHPQLRGNIP
jgi:hypothetical protein